MVIWLTVTGESGEKIVYIDPVYSARNILTITQVKRKAKESASQSREVDAHASRRTRCSVD